jgi:hypothetical protein
MRDLIWLTTPPSTSPDCKLAHNCVNNRVISGDTGVRIGLLRQAALSLMRLQTFQNKNIIRRGLARAETSFNLMMKIPLL